MSALRSAVRVTVISRSAAHHGRRLRGAAQPAQHGTSGPVEQMAKVLALRGKFRSPPGLARFRGVWGRVVNVLVTEVMLQRACIDLLVRMLITGGVPGISGSLRECLPLLLGLLPVGFSLPSPGSRCVLSAGF